MTAADVSPDPASAGPPPDPDGPDADAWLTRAEASIELARFGVRMKPATLARAWSTGTPPGPPCRHVRGKPLYPRDLLRAWARAQITAPACSARERDLQRRAARHSPAPGGGHG